MPVEDAADGARTGDAQSSWLLDCVSFLNINPVEACCHGFTVTHQQFVQVLLHSGAGLQNANEQTTSTDFREKQCVKNGCKGHFMKCGGKSAFACFRFCTDRLLAGHIKVSHKLLNFPEDASELENP